MRLLIFLCMAQLCTAEITFSCAPYGALKYLTIATDGCDELSTFTEKQLSVCSIHVEPTCAMVHPISTTQSVIAEKDSSNTDLLVDALSRLADFYDMPSDSKLEIKYDFGGFLFVKGASDCSPLTEALTRGAAATGFECSTQTTTETSTVTSTATNTATTGTSTVTSSATSTDTSTGTTTDASTATTSQSSTAATTHSNTGSTTVTSTVTSTYSTTAITSQSTTVTSSASSTGVTTVTTSQTSTVSSTRTSTGTSTQSGTDTTTASSTATYTQSSSATTSLSSTATSTGSSTAWSSATTSATSTATNTATTATTTATSSQSASQTSSATTTGTTTAESYGTSSITTTGSSTASTTATHTATTATSTATSSATTSAASSATTSATSTVTNTATTATTTATSSGTNSATTTGTSSATTSGTSTGTSTASTTVTNTATTATSTATSSKTTTGSSSWTTTATSTATSLLTSGLICSPKGEMTFGVTESIGRCNSQAAKLEEALATCAYLLGDLKPKIECVGKAGFFYLSVPSNCDKTVAALNAVAKAKSADIGIDFKGAMGCGLDKFLMQATECDKTADILTAVVEDSMKGTFDLCQTTSQTTTASSTATSTRQSTDTTTATSTQTSTLFPSSLQCSTLYGTVKGFGVVDEDSCNEHTMFINEALSGCPAGSDGKQVNVGCTRVGGSYVLVAAGSKDCNGLATRLSTLSRTAREALGLSNVEEDAVGCAFNTYLYSIPAGCSSAVGMVNTLVDAHVHGRVAECAVDPTTSTTTTEHSTTTSTTKTPTTTLTTTASTTPSSTPTTTQSTTLVTTVTSTATTTPTTAAFSGGLRCNAMYGAVQAVGVPSRFNCSHQVGILNEALNGCPAWNAENPSLELSCQKTSSDFEILRSHFLCGKTASAITALADQVGSYILGTGTHGPLGCLYDVYLRSTEGPASCSGTVDTLNKAIEMQMRGHLDPCWMLGLTTPTTTAESTTTTTSTSTTTTTMNITAVKSTFVAFSAPPTTQPTTLAPAGAQALVIGFTSPHPYTDLPAYIVAEIQALIERLVTENTDLTTDDIVSIVLTEVKMDRGRRADYYLIQANAVLSGTVSQSAAAAAAASLERVLNTAGAGELQLVDGTTLVVVGVLAAEAKDVLLGGNTAQSTRATTANPTDATVSAPNGQTTSTSSSTSSSLGETSDGNSAESTSDSDGLPTWSIAVLVVVAIVCIAVAVFMVVWWRKAIAAKDAADPWSKKNTEDPLISGMLVGSMSPTMSYMDPAQFAGTPDPNDPIVGNFTGWDETVRAVDNEVASFMAGTGDRGTVVGSSDFESHYYNMPYVTGDGAGGGGVDGHMLNVPENSAVEGVGAPSTHFYPGEDSAADDSNIGGGSGGGGGGGMFADYASDDGYADESSDDESMVDVSERAKEIFAMFDTDGNGDLSPDEMARMIRAMQNSSEQEAVAAVGSDDGMFDFDMLDPEAISEMLFMEVDIDGDGEISLDEFVLTCEQPGPLYDLVQSADMDNLTVGAPRKKAKELYQLFDTDGNGDLSIPEVSELVKAMIIADSGSLTAKELSSIDSMIVAEILRLEFDRDGDGVVTLDEFLDRCCNQQGMMAELVTFTSAPGMDPPEENPGRNDADAKLAAKLRRRTAAAASSVYNKFQAEDKATKIAERQQHQSSAAANLRAQQEDASARADASASLTLSANASKALGTASTSAALFGEDPELSADPTAGKSKIWLALNPQPLARQTAAERRAQEEEAEEDNADGKSDAESDMGFGSDESGFSDSSDDDFDDNDLEIDPAVAARLEANRKKREEDESQRASELKLQHMQESEATAVAMAEEMKVIEARQQIERRESQKEQNAIVAEAQKRMTEELKFDFNFFAAADADGDGMLSLEEAMAQGMTEEMFRQIDADGNGQLTQEEFAAWMKHGPPPAAPPPL